MIDETYINAKWMLLNVVAKSSRCRAVFQKYFAMATVVGFEADLDTTETLFTSLLVQAQVAMQSAASSAPPGTAARSRSFRSSFLLAYAYRVGERLAEINAHVVADAEAETGRSILPVLAARSSIVDATVSEIFPNLGTMRSRAESSPPVGPAVVWPPTAPSSLRRPHETDARDRIVRQAGHSHGEAAQRGQPFAYRAAASANGIPSWFASAKPREHVTELVHLLVARTLRAAFANSPTSSASHTTVAGMPRPAVRSP